MRLRLHPCRSAGNPMVACALRSRRTAPASAPLRIALSPRLAVARPRRSRPGASHLVCACTVSPILQRTPMLMHGSGHRCHRQHVRGDVVWRCRWVPVDTSCRRARHWPPLRGPGSTQGHGRASYKELEGGQLDPVPSTDPVSRHWPPLPDPGSSQGNGRASTRSESELRRSALS